MFTNFRKTKLLLFLGSLILLSLACGSLQLEMRTPTPAAGVESATETGSITEGTQPESPSIIETAVPTQAEDFSHLWLAYRDPAYGYGVALPAHWHTNPTPTGGYAGGMTTANFDEAYFLAHATKGWWTGGVIPEGVIKMDFAGMPDPDPNLELAAALEAMYQGSDTTVVLGTEPVTYNSHEAVLMTTASPNHLEETFQSVVFRLPDGNILMVTAFWGDVLSTSDVQTILNSFAFPNEMVALPTIAPSPPLDSEEQSDSDQKAVAWVGHVIGFPEGSQFDDFVLLSPAGAGEFGITGSTSEIETEIHFLRNATGPDEYVHFWGQFTCEVEDYNGCQLIVDEIHRTGYIEDQAQGWVGTIVTSSFNGGRSNVFQLEGKVPMWYSLHASQDPNLQAQIEALSDTGARVQVWGTLMIGVPDVGGTRIEPFRLDVIENGQIETDLWPELENLTANWSVYSNQRFGYSFKYPVSTTIEEHTVVSLPSEEIPAGMSADLYLEQLQLIYPQLCVGIRYGLGWIYISAPPNAGARYNPCGRTGVGVAEITSKTEEVILNNQIYNVQGMEISGSAEHSEMFILELENGTCISFGGGGATTADYESYLADNKPVLLQILASYKTIP